MLNKWIIVVFLSSFFACAQLPAASLKASSLDVPITVIYKGNQCLCQENDFQVKQLVNQTEVDALITQGNRTILGGSKKATPSINFSHEVIVAIWMGKKPTAGYQLSLEKETAVVKDNTAVIQVNVVEPDKNTVLAQTTTSPCMLIKLSKGEYNTITIRSQKEDPLVKLSIK
jgi:hypothetical protein